MKLSQFMNTFSFNAFIVLWYEETKTLYAYEELTKKEWNLLQNTYVKHICINGNAIQLCLKKGE